MTNFKDVAEKAVSSSFIMAGRTERKNDEMLAGFPNGFTITGAECVPVTNDDGTRGEMPVYTIKEDAKIFGKGGSALAKIFHEWVKSYNGDYESMSADLASAGGVKVKLTVIRLKGGRNYTSVEVLD